MNEWAEYIREGQQYLKTATNGRKRKQVFSNELIYNLIGLSVEKFLVGLCMHRGHMPNDHTISGIVAETHQICPMEMSLVKEIHMMNHIQDMCSLEVNSLCIVNDKQIDNLLDMNQRVAVFVEKNLNQPAVDFLASK